MPIRTDDCEPNVLALLSSCGRPLSRKKIVSRMKKKRKRVNDGEVHRALKKGDIKKALKRLVSSGQVEEVNQDGKRRFLFSSANNMESRLSQPSSFLEDEPNELPADKGINAGEALPFAELMRRQQRETSQLSEDDKFSNEVGENVDDEIARLEAELAAESDDSDASSQSDEEESESDSGDCGDGVVRLSNLSQDERIAPLPESALPKNKRRKLKGIDNALAGEENLGETKQGKGKGAGNQVSKGLQDAVKEVLSGYVARSNERIPFYCRVCAYQAKTLEDFKAHKRTDFHLAAVQAEKKATYCQACRKQFTSPIQMKEHLQSRPHKEKMDYLRSKNSGGSGGRGFGGRRNGKAGSARRQWC